MTASPLFLRTNRRATTVVAVGLVGLLGLLAALPSLLDDPTKLALYGGEGSLAEVASMWAWVLVAVALPVVLHAATGNVVAASAVCLACAAREADWHKLFTGYSILKPKFYLLEQHPISSRLIAAIVVGFVLTSAVITARALWRGARKDGGLRAPWVWVLLVALVLLVVGKAADRLPEILEPTSMALPEATRRSLRAIEEITELLLPALVLTAAILFARSRRVGVQERGFEVRGSGWPSAR